MPSRQAMSSIIRSASIMPCGPPNPLNAVFETVSVLTRRERIRTLG